MHECRAVLSGTNIPVADQTTDDTPADDIDGNGSDDDADNLVDFQPAVTNTRLRCHQNGLSEDRQSNYNEFCL